MQTIPSGRALLITQFDLGNGRWIQSRFKGAGKNFVACMLLDVGNLTLNFNKLQYMYVLVLKQPFGIEQVLKNLSLRSRNSQKKKKHVDSPIPLGQDSFWCPLKADTYFLQGRAKRLAVQVTIRCFKYVSNFPTRLLGRL